MEGRKYCEAKEGRRRGVRKWVKDGEGSRMQEREGWKDMGVREVKGMKTLYRERKRNKWKCEKGKAVEGRVTRFG